MPLNEKFIKYQEHSSEVKICSILSEVEGVKLGPCADTPTPLNYCPVAVTCFTTHRYRFRSNPASPSQLWVDCALMSPSDEDVMLPPEKPLCFTCVTVEKSPDRISQTIDILEHNQNGTSSPGKAVIAFALERKIAKLTPDVAKKDYCRFGNPFGDNYGSFDEPTQ